MRKLIYTYDTYSGAAVGRLVDDGAPEPGPGFIEQFNSRVAEGFRQPSSGAPSSDPRRSDPAGEC